MAKTNPNAWTNEIKKGMRIKQYNGWYGTMMDNKRGNIRLVEVEGIFTDIGSIYASDISSYRDSNGIWHGRPTDTSDASFIGLVQTALDDSDGDPLDIIESFM